MKLFENTVPLLALMRDIKRASSSDVDLDSKLVTIKKLISDYESSNRPRSKGGKLRG